MAIKECKYCHRINGNHFASCKTFDQKIKTNVMKRFQIDDYTKEGENIILFCSNKGKDFELTFAREKFIDWLKDTDRFTSEIMEWVNGECTGPTSVLLTEDEYWGNCSYASICQDLYEYVILRLIAPHELFNGMEKALLNILKSHV